MSGPRMVVCDIETSPNVADVWGLFNQNISIGQLRESTRMIGFAAKVVGKPGVEWRSDFHDGHEAMVQRAWEIYNDADVLVTYNGTTFDLKHLRREFILAGLTPPSPVQEVDLLRVVKRQFRFTSNKLQYVSTQLGLEGKKQHSGHSLWVGCMAGDEKAWSTMRAYCKQDVVLTEKLYDKLRAWVPSHPHIGLYTGEDCCSNCGSKNLTHRGFSLTGTGKYQRYQCGACGKWSRGKRAVATVDARGVA